MVQRLQNKKVDTKKIGFIPYKKALDLQNKFFNQIIQIKLANQKLPSDQQEITPNYLLFCEHPHTYTLGRSGSLAHLLVDKNNLATKKITFHTTNRGGDITYHGPGQMVVYPILDLENFFTDIHEYLRMLEEAVINTLYELGLVGGRIQGLTGVWIDHTSPEKAKKIAALGIKISRWVTMHGLALNVQPDLSYFRDIIPCGIHNRQVTSIFKEIGEKYTFQEILLLLQKNLFRLFKMEKG